MCGTEAITHFTVGQSAASEAASKSFEGEEQEVEERCEVRGQSCHVLLLASLAV